MIAGAQVLFEDEVRAEQMLMKFLRSILSFFQTQGCFDPSQELDDAERLGDVIVRAHRQETCQFVGRHLAGQQQNLEVSTGRVCSKLCETASPLIPGMAMSSKSESYAHIWDNARCFGAAVGFVATNAFRFEHRATKAANLRIIVYDKDFGKRRPRGKRYVWRFTPRLQSRGVGR